MALADYTSFAEVRAVLGVNIDELDDATLELDVYSHNLLAELEDVSADLPAGYAVVAAITPAGDRTPAQRRLYETTRLFAAYAVAKQLASSLPLFSPKSVTDGKAGFSRYSDSPFKETVKKVEEGYATNRQRVLNAYGVYASASTTAVLRPYFSVVSPATDPVIG